VSDDESYDSTDSFFSSEDSGSSASNESSETNAEAVVESAQPLHKRMLKLRIGRRGSIGAKEGGEFENSNPNVHVMEINFHEENTNNKNIGVSSLGAEEAGMELVANQRLLNKYSETVLNEC
jgi:hypothetical protein